jgi:hypothetical protein
VCCSSALCWGTKRYWLLLEHVLLLKAIIPAVVRCVHLKCRPTGSGWPREEWVHGLVMLAAAVFFFCDRPGGEHLVPDHPAPCIHSGSM